MATTCTLGRSFRHENESGITGSRAEEVNGVDHLDQIVSAGAEEQLAMGLFKDHQLQAMGLLSDKDAEAMFLGVRYAILDLNVVGPDTITYTGDLEQEIFAGDLVRVEGTVADDGLYHVTLVAEAIGVTTLTIGDGVAWPVGAGGAVGTFARVASFQRIGYTYDIATATLATGAITYAGDLTDKFAAGDEIVIVNSTGNDGYYTLLTVTELAGVTTLTVVGAALADNTNDGDFYKVRAAIKLSANEAYLWGVESGLPNPFIGPPLALTTPGDCPYFNATRGDVAYCMVNVPGAVNAQIDGRIAIDPIL
ncbi:MAG TPA: hypothetical protein VMY37_27865 [Thermoguttaceae bacterium]|nr:hypothetical protein [Thermoguttaceae bacterium]